MCSCGVCNLCGDRLRVCVRALPLPGLFSCINNQCHSRAPALRSNLPAGSHPCVRVRVHVSSWYCVLCTTAAAAAFQGAGAAAVNDESKMRRGGAECWCTGWQSGGRLDFSVCALAAPGSRAHYTASDWHQLNSIIAYVSLRPTHCRFKPLLGGPRREIVLTASRSSGPQ